MGPNETFMHFLIEEFQRKIVSEHNNALSDFLKKRLLELGYNFKNENQFLEFIHERLTRISILGKPGYYEIYLDYGSKSQKALVSYGDELKMEWDEKEPYRLNATISHNYS